MRQTQLIIFATLLMLACGCSRSDSRWRPDTSWHTEAVTEEATSFRGSYQNALDTLRVRSQAWKLIALHGTNQCEWGFKVAIEFPDHPDYKPDQFGGVSFMPVTKIKYQLFDKDGFRLTTLVLDDAGMGVAEKETHTFQHSGMMPRDLARRAAYGRLDIQAGYVPKKE